MKKTVFVFILLVILALNFSARAEEGVGFARREVVVVTGNPLSSLYGTAPSQLSLFAMTAKGFEPVPFQIDKRYRECRQIKYAYTGGHLAKKVKNPNLEALDELLFWSGDAGSKVPSTQWPASTRGVEIEITDPVSGAKGYVYLLAFDGVAPCSDRWYVRYDPAADKVEALSYDLSYPARYKLGFTSLVIKTEAGGSGENLIEEAKYWVSGRLGGTIIPYDLDRNQVHSRIVAYIEGPIRARRKLVNYIELFVYLGSTSFAESVYEPGDFSVEVPVVGFLPIRGLTNVSTRWALELNAKTIGMTFKSDKNPQGIEIDGKMSEAERNLSYAPPQWLLISGRPGALLRRPGKVSKRPLYIDLYYMDDENYEEVGEASKGQLGAAGYYIPFAGRRGMKIRENIVDYFTILPNYQLGDEAKFLDGAAKPIQIGVSGMTAANPEPGPAAWPAPRKERKDAASPTYKYTGAEAPIINSQILPVFVLSSDNGFGGGLMWVHANPFNTGVRFMTQSWYTIKSYSLTEFVIGEEVPRPGGNLSFWSHGKYQLKPGRDFYGLGNDSLRENRSNFYDEIFSWDARVQRRIYGPIWGGLYGELHHEYTTNGEGDWAPDTFSPEMFPDLLGKGSFWTNRIGLYLMHDTRNSYYIPTHGGYRKIEFYAVPKWLGNDFEFEYWYLDLRQFITIRGPRKDILALRLQARHATGGPIPFYELSVAGSEYTLRGYFDGRFRDRDMAVANVELRHNLWKVVDINLFYDLGRVYPDIFDMGNRIVDDLHNAYGIGFRIAIPPSIVMRGDVGWSNTDQVFYFNFGQTF